jgi:flagellar protein FlaG
MEVGRIGQGGPVNIDYTSKSEVSSEATTTQVVTKVAENTNKTSNNLSREKENPTEKEVKKAVDKLNKFLEADNISVEYAVHEKFGDLMIKIVDSKTKDIILEVPPRKILDMVAKMMETVGIVLDKRA